ncbi:MAG: MBL fold metallo-hydrolase [Reyranella sp.]|jgi:glyoxylase-like metal-dependent hydrolase (beta-lactamase superfamily II)|nr:MBL fold metallo-hydrolase [Reyranella sp.]
MIVTSQSANALGCTSGSWKIWSLSDGHVDMSADLLRRGPGLGKYTLTQDPSLVRLSVNCFLLEGAGKPGILIDCGAGGRWEPTLGHLDAALIEAGIDPASIGTVALTHTHLDHLNGLVTRDGRVGFPSLSRIAIAHDAVAGFVDQPHLERFRHLLAPVGDGDPVSDQVAALSIPGHAAGHMAYVLDTAEDRILFCGDVIHVPAAQFARPELTWAYDDDQAMARATRLNLLREASTSQTWLAGAHMAKPGIGRVVVEGPGYALLPIA